jgi:hypothetical protein
MIVWQGWGILAPIIVVAGLIGVQLAANGIFGPGTYESSSVWPGLGLLLSAPVVWLAGRRLNGQVDRVLVDPSSGQQVVLRRQHTFFFVKVEYWAMALAVGGVVALVKGMIAS